MFGKKSPKSPPLPDLLQATQAGQVRTAAARRFLEFCQQDYPTHTKADGFDPQVYLDAVKLVLNRLEATRHME
ncbi:MAG: hypothetical protein R3E93_10370 [Thiothrix sp.]